MNEAAFEPPEALILRLEFSFDGKWLVAGSRGSDLLRWEIPSFDWEKTAQRDQGKAHRVREGVKIRHMSREEISALAAHPPAPHG